MATYQFGVNVPTDMIADATVELYSETGALIGSVFRSSLVVWDLTDASAIGEGDSVGNSDELIANDADNLIFWDTLTLGAYTGGASATRYFLPAAGQFEAIDIFRLEDGGDILNLTHNSEAGGQAYDFVVTAYGGDGNDLLLSGGGSDHLFGDQGSDTIFGGGGNDLIDLGSAFPDGSNETAFGSDGNDSIVGGSGLDTLFGGNDDDRIDGGGGSDEVSGDVGNDTLYGGIGITSDALYGGADNDTLYGGQGIDDLEGNAGFLDRMFGGDGEDNIVDSDGMVMMSGGAGDDIMDSRFVVTWTAAGNLATVLGGGGSDTFNMNSSQQNLNLVIAMDDGSADGTDTVGFSAVANSYNTSTATLGGGNDGYRGSLGGNGARTDRVAGEAGNDTVYGGAGSDTLDGGTGFLDFLIGGATTALATDAADVLVDADGVAYARGGEGDDSLTITFASNWVGVGGNASDLVTLDGNGGGDLFTLGGNNAAQRVIINADDGSADGNDIVNWSAASSYAGVTATMGDGNDVYNAAVTGGSGTLLDTVFGGAGNDTLYGGSDQDSLYGGLGSDTLYGGAGFIDRLYGDDPGASLADGDDSLFDSDGVAYARGGQGNDAFNITFAANWVGEGGNAFDVVTLDGGGGADSFVLVSGNAAQRLVINTDDGTTNGNDVVDWSGVASSYDVVTVAMLGGDDNYIGTGPGGSGNLVDIVYGGIGNDTLSGGIGNDTLFGSNAGNAASDGGDTLFGRGGDDTLFGGYGIDTLDGGADNDTLLFNTDNTVTGDNAAQDYVQGWDGSAQLAQYGYSGRTVNWSFDSFEGSAGVDSLIGTAGDDVLLANTDDLYINGAGQASSPGRMGGIEIVLLGAGTDIFIANDPNGNTASGTAFTTSLTVYGGDGGDVVYTGNGNDLIVGDLAAGGIDVLAGGVGDDTIWGDLQGFADSATGARDTIYGGGGNDTLYGGAGGDTFFGGNGTDTIDAGAGDDHVFDTNNTGLLFGGDGSDTFVLGYTNAGQVMTPSRTGNDAIGDGDDRVYIWVDGGGLQYGSISLAMGAGNDVYITGDVVGGNGFDRIMGESGNDVISSWNGNDTIDGGSGDDGLWGGAGVDTIMGGADGDYLYGGAGDGDLLIGGDGSDYYYWGRTDGIDRIDDQDTVAGGEADNYILVMPAYDPVTEQPIAGTGVVETDHDLYDNAGGDDMVQLVDLDGAGSGTMYRMTILQGAGAGSSIEFDQTEISVIGLWNHDATAGTQVITVYAWDPIDGRYEYQA